MEPFVIGQSLEYPGSGSVTLDRESHLTIWGGTGTGKSTLMLQIFKDAVYHGHSVIVVEPHGSFADACLKHIPKPLTHKVVVIDLLSPKPVGFNPFAIADKTRAANNFLDSLIGVFGESAIMDRSQALIRNFLQALLEVHPDANPCHFLRMLYDLDYTEQIINATSKNLNHVKLYFAALKKNKEKHVAISAPANKVGKLVDDPNLRALFAHKNPIDFEHCINNGYIIIVRASKSMGEENVQFLMSLITGMVKNVVFSRPIGSSGTVKGLPWCTYIVDEVHNCVKGHALGTLFSESRKFCFRIVPADQSTEQISTEAWKSIPPNSTNYLVTRVAAKDAKILGDELRLQNPNELLDTDRGVWFIKRIRDGRALKTRKIQVSKDPPHYGDEQDPYEILKQSAWTYGKPKQKILESAAQIFAPAL